MQQIAEYIVSVSAAAFLCGILNSLMLKGTAKEILKLVSGLFLAFCVISPVSDIQLPELAEIGKEWQEKAQAAAQAGEEMAQDALSESISQQLEAYILDKAESLGLTLEVQVFLKEDDSCMPESVTITGDAPASARRQMTQEISDALGIQKEDVQWTKKPS